MLPILSSAGYDSPMTRIAGQLGRRPPKRHAAPPAQQLPDRHPPRGPGRRRLPRRAGRRVGHARQRPGRGLRRGHLGQRPAPGHHQADRAAAVPGPGRGLVRLPDAEPRASTPTAAPAPGPAPRTTRGWISRRCWSTSSTPAVPTRSRPRRFAQVDHTNPAEVKAAIALFGYVWTGINVLNSNMDDFNAGRAWDYNPASPLDGGHSVHHRGLRGAGRGRAGRVTSGSSPGRPKPASPTSSGSGMSRKRGSSCGPSTSAARNSWQASTWPRSPRITPQLPGSRGPSR